MKKQFKRTVSCLVIISLLMVFFPAFQGSAAQQDTITLENENIEVTVSTKNGGFIVRTKDGNVFNKDDDNKNLLFHNGEFDTSFASFQVTKGGQTKEYIFGGNYTFLGLGENTLSVQQVGDGIVSTWSVDDLTFTQLLQPVWSEGANEHGAVALCYTVENSSAEPAGVKVRLLLDTALGQQDYAYYELAQTAGGYSRIETEQIVTGSDIPANFFAYDNIDNPGVTAYTISDTSQDGMMPYQAAFGHWNNLAATVFDFTPDNTLTFTNPGNKRYLTADSAYALYYDMGEVTADNDEGGGKSFLTYYGVYSNIDTKATDTVAVNITSASELLLNDDKTMYIGDSGSPDGRFKVTTNIESIASEKAVMYDNIAVAVYPDAGFDPLDSSGESVGASYNNPHWVSIGNFNVGEQRQLEWLFNAEVGAAPGYRKITFKVFSMPEEANNKLLLENQIGSAYTYVYCPGGDGELPEILFTGASPRILYFEGTRHFYITGSNLNMLEDSSRYSLQAYAKMPDFPSYEGPDFYTIPNGNVTLTQDESGNPMLDVIMMQEMALGDYRLAFEWNPGQNPGTVDECLTAPALEFTVTDDPSYRNDYYGIVAITKTSPSVDNWEYNIEAFPGEVQLKAFKANNTETEILIEIRGEFQIEKDEYDNIKKCTAVTVNETDTININGVLDVINGDVKAEVLGDGIDRIVYVDMEGEILTTNSRTAVWTGVANLTPLKNGTKNIGLRAYNNAGERMTAHEAKLDSIISIQWPSEYEILQTIGGMAVSLRYGEFGKMYDTGSTTQLGEDEELMGYVLSFGANLDLSSLMPKGKGPDPGPDPAAVEYAKLFPWERTAITTLAAHEKAKEDAKKENENNKTKPVGRVNVEDVLFGLDRGYIGFNAQAELTLPKYTDALPELGGTLDIHTVNGYSFGVTGKTKTELFEMEFELRVIGSPDSNIPVPDKIYFHMEGPPPGVNIEGFGIIWVNGLGGGIDKLYDTIFSSGLPPLTLMLTIDFGLLQVLDARGDLTLSLRGFTLKVSDVKLLKTEAKVLNYANLAIKWYPDLYLLINAQADILSILKGTAYLVLDDDFWEFFMRVTVNIPKQIPLLGGMKFADADLGANAERIWGGVNAFGALKVGVCYYWGGEFSFGQQDIIKPTYPELLGFDDIPVGYTEDTGKTLYMRVGTNFTLAGRAALVEDLDRTGPILMDSQYVMSSADRLEHVLNLGTNDSDDYILNIEFAQGGPASIPDVPSKLTILKPDGTDFALDIYDETNPDSDTPQECNANLIYDDETGKSSVSVAFPSEDYIAGDWTITTAFPADITLYNVAPLPGISTFNAVKIGNELSLSWTGSMLAGKQIDFFVTGDIGEGTDGIGEMGVHIGSASSFDDGGSTMLTLPGDLKSGTYYVRMLAQNAFDDPEDTIHSLVLATSGGNAYTFDHVNANQPDEPGGVSIANAGNLMYDVTVIPPTNDFDGYLVSVYESDGEGGLVPTDLSGLEFEKEEPILAGGSYQAADAEGNLTDFGLTAGKEYCVGVTAYRTMNAGTEDEYIITSNEATSGFVMLNVYDPPEISFIPGESYESLPRTMNTSTGLHTIYVDTFTENNISFMLTPNETVASGQWYVDDMKPQAVSNVSIAGVDVEMYLPEGDHTVTFTGKDADGDGFTYTKLFSVDTTPPRLMLSSPTNGSFFSENGKLTVSGVTDTDALFTVIVDGQTVIDNKTLPDMGYTVASDGTFSFTLDVDPGFSSHIVDITAQDAAGNSVTKTSVVSNAGLSSIECLDILNNGLLYSNNNLVLNKYSNTTAALSLMATTANGNQFVIRDSQMVEWEAVAREGSASIDQSGNIEITPGSAGIAVASFRVADKASMTVAMTFGAEAYHDLPGSKYTLTLASTPGGTVTGGGNYEGGEAVAITAMASSGYRFICWSSSDGGSFEDYKSTKTTFTMPANNTTVMATFKHIASSGKNGSEQDTRNVGIGKGEMVSVKLTDDLLAEGSKVVPYYMLNGEKHIVPNSIIIDGNLVFIAPVAGEFGIETNEISFTDIAGHWAQEYISFVASRGLVNGIGSEKFDPYGAMSRAMFVTILARLDGVDQDSYTNVKFADVESGSWYESAVTWAYEGAIVNGISERLFDPDARITREQMAVILNNYIEYKGYEFEASGESPAPPADSGSISSWAADAVSQMQYYGIMTGKPGNLFDPLGDATRAEACTVFMRLIEAILKR